MSKVKLNYKAIDISDIEDLISSLDKAIAFLNRNSVPSDFSKKNSFNSVVNNLKKSCNELNEIRIWLVNSNKNYDKLIDNLNSQASKLPSDLIKRRNKII